MTCIEAVLLTGNQKSLTEVHRKRDQLLDFQRFHPFLGLSGRYVG